MTDSVTLIMSNAALRDKAKRWIDKVPDYTRITFLGPRRTLPQNARIWSALNDVAKQLTYHGLKLSAADWRVIYMDALWRETRLVPSLNQDAMLDLRRSSTADLSVSEANDFLDLIYAHGSQNGVQFSVDRYEAALLATS